MWIVGSFFALATSAQMGVAGDKASGAYRQVRIERSVFTGEAVGMLEQEKRSLAQQIAVHVVNELAYRVVKGEGGAARLVERMISLALNLDPRNRTAVVTNVQLGRGVLPEKVEADYSPEVLSQLMVTRAKLLGRTGDSANMVLAGFLFEIAVEIYPRNEDAIYEHEMFRLDSGEVDWGLLVTGAEGK